MQDVLAGAAIATGGAKHERKQDMNNRSQLLSVVEKWKAFKSNPAFLPNSSEWKDAHAAYESALHEAGMYKEALRGQRVLNEDVRAHTEEPEHTFFHWAYKYANQDPETLNALHKAKSYTRRTEILDEIKAKFDKAEQKKEEARLADCQRRTAILVEEARKQTEQARAERAHEEQHKAELIAESIARALPKHIIAVVKAKSEKKKLSPRKTSLKG